MTRLVDWRARLQVYVGSHLRAPFAYGTHDCGLFAIGGADTITGRELADPWRGRYTSLRGAVRLLRAAGYRDHVDFAAQHFPEKPPGRLAPGDIALVVTITEGPLLALCGGPSIFAVAPSGLMALPISAAMRAFEV